MRRIERRIHPIPSRMKLRFAEVYIAKRKSMLSVNTEIFRTCKRDGCGNPSEIGGTSAHGHGVQLCGFSPSERWEPPWQNASGLYRRGNWAMDATKSDELSQLAFFYKFSYEG